MNSGYFINGKVFTGRGEDDFVTAFQVTDGQISWVGDATDVLEGEGIDLEGKTVLPGFIDVHTHPSYVAMTLGAVACTPPLVNSIDEMVAALRTHPNAGKGTDQWIEGWGYDESKLAERRTPTTADLDRVSVTQPVYVLRSDCHSGVCNTRALELAGITKDTPDPEGARFGRYVDGTPNGALIEHAANDKVMKAKGVQGYQAEVDKLAAVGDHYNERGIVAVTDMFAVTTPYPYLQLYRDAAAKGLPQQAIIYYQWADLAAHGTPDFTDDDRTGDVRVGGIKLFMDGSMSNRTAWMIEPYPDSDDHGMTTLTDDSIGAAHAYARRNQLQMVFHVMGDQAIQHILDYFDAEEPWMGEIPSVRLDHATMLNRAQMEQLRASSMNYGVVAQIIFFFAEYDSYRANLTDSQFRRAYALKDMYEMLDFVALSSDSPATTWMDPDNVFTSIKAAVVRKAYNGADIVPEQAITVPQAVLLYTARSAKLANLPGLGKIAPGFDASFITVDQDIFTIDPGSLDRTQVDAAWIRGDKVYERT
jgi:predicted amidohydrolase YtcJ